MKTNLTEPQYKSLDSLISLLQDLKVIKGYAIISDQRYDTVEQYKQTREALMVDASWQSFYNIEDILISK